MFHRWPSFNLFLCSSIDLCGFDIYVSGFVPVCTVRYIFRWFDCDFCKLNSFALGSIHFWGVWFTFWWIDLFLRGSIYIWASWTYLHEVRFIFWPFNNVCTRFILFILWLEDFGRNGTPCHTVSFSSHLRSDHPGKRSLQGKLFSMLILDNFALSM